MEYKNILKLPIYYKQTIETEKFLFFALLQIFQFYYFKIYNYRIALARVYTNNN